MSASAASSGGAPSGELAQGRAHVEEHQRGEREALGHGRRRRGRRGARAKTSPCSGWRREPARPARPPAPSATRQQRRRVLAQRRAPRPRRPGPSPSAVRIAAPRRSGDISVRKASAASRGAARGERWRRQRRASGRKYRPCPSPEHPGSPSSAVCAVAALALRAQRLHRLHDHPGRRRPRRARSICCRRLSGERPVGVAVSTGRRRSTT